MARIFSGIQPSGELHIGNWLGAVRNWVALQDQYDCIYCVVDLHAITGKYDAASLARRTTEMATGLIAAGVDPEKVTLFAQSHVPEHAELMWLLNTVSPLGELERMTQFKDKSAGMESIPAGLFNYPILMAADILLYRADLVPVGEDQVQHLELAREIARRWNAQFCGEADGYFPEPKPMHTEARRIMGLDGDAKMSKSRGNTIALLEEPDQILAKLKPAKTDPQRLRKSDVGRPEHCNLYTLHKHFSSAETTAHVDAQCRSAGWGCVECKTVLAQSMSDALAPIRARAAELAARPQRVHEILHEGAKKARAIARETIAEVRDRMGFLPERS